MDMCSTDEPRQLGVKFRLENLTGQDLVGELDADRKILFKSIIN
jgi:hypothetical protein